MKKLLRAAMTALTLAACATKSGQTDASPALPAPPPAATEALAPTAPVWPDSPKVPEAGGPLRAMVLSYQHYVRSTALTPNTQWLATGEELFAFKRDAAGASKEGVRIPFHGRFTATPDGSHLFRYDDREIVALDAQGKDSGSPVKLRAKIWGVAYSPSSRLMGVFTMDSFVTIFRAADLHPVLAAASNEDLHSLSTSSDDAFIMLGGSVFDTRTGQPSTTPANTRVVDRTHEMPPKRTTREQQTAGHVPLMRGQNCSAGTEFRKCYPAEATIHDGQVVVDNGAGVVLRARLAPPGTPTVPSEFTWALPDLQFLGELTGRIVVAREGADIVLLDAHTHVEQEQYLFGERGILHVRKDGTWETTGDAAELEPAVLCTDGHRVELAAACKRKLP